ncbi:hypothetical protein IVP04_13335 [Mammaliicoccus sciuri]|uniref:hypothetical protein n=1 Tax=Mammaliicoccus sciuri TaxID=1296 RepID=UPI001E514460|nr:hypothetical protein [Mammaliicoccus sciuri]MCD5142310.1 hypothetical protein [Mammaliicoccus sciuri]
MKEKTNIEIKGEKQKLYSSRQITQIIDLISEKHYKNEIIVEISNKNNIKNIIILDESIKMNQKYIGLVEDNFVIDSKSLLSIYHKGKPYSASIDLNIILMRECFIIFHQIFQHYQDNGHKMNMDDKETLLYELYQLLLNVNEEKFNSRFEKYFESHTSFDKKKVKRLKENLNKQLDLYNKFEIYNSTKANNDFKEENYKDVIRLEKQFIYHFNRLSKPMLYVQFENDQWKMLGVKMIKEEYFEHSNPQFLDINMIKQTSPLLISLAVSTPFIPIMIKLSHALYQSKVKDNQYKTNLTKLDDVIESNEIQLIQPDLTLNEIDEMEKKVNKKIDELPESLKSKIKEGQSAIINTSIPSLRENKIYFENIEINNKR